MNRRVEVVVVGAGPAGAATAGLLAAAGRDVLLLDRVRFPRPKLCGDYVHPEGVALLDGLGVLDRLTARGQRVWGMAIVSPAGRTVIAPFPAGAGLSIRRDVLDQALVRKAAEAGAEVATGRPVRGISRVWRRGSRWRVATDTGDVEADVVVGADGRGSLIGRATGLRSRQSRTGRYAVGLYVRGLPAPRGVAEMHLGGGAYCGVSSFADGRANVTMVVPREVLRTWRGRLGGAARDFLRRFPHLAGRVDAASSVETVRATGPLAPSTGPVVGNGVLLVGDAATFTDPLTGQGVTLGLAGAVAAAETIGAALRRDTRDAAALEPYARWHRHRFRALRPFLALVDVLARRPGLLEPLICAWERRPDLAAEFLSVIGCGTPPAHLIGPRYVLRLLRAA